MVISLGSVEERDDWIFKMKSLVENLKVSFHSIHSIIADVPIIPAETKSSEAGSSVHTGLTCLGVTIIKESKISKLQENQPTLLSNSKSESDSLLNEIAMNVQQRCKLVENVFPGNTKSIFGYLLFCRGICCKILSKFENIEKERIRNGVRPKQFATLQNSRYIQR